jgi:uncharacterized protein YdeI (YjbR/CyaY-like superfamily)
MAKRISSLFFFSQTIKDSEARIGKYMKQILEGRGLED